MPDEVIKKTPEEAIAQSIVPCTDLAYIAGLLDGEGRVAIKTHQSKRQINPSFSLVAEIDNTSKPAIDFVQERLGGAIWVKDRGNYRAVYHLSWCADNAQAVLKLLLPYLIIKKDIAEIGIAFQDMRHLKDGLRRDSVPKWQLEIMEVMYDRAKQLNLRGPRQ